MSFRDLAAGVFNLRAVGWSGQRASNRAHRVWLRTLAFDECGRPIRVRLCSRSFLSFCSMEVGGHPDLHGDHMDEDNHERMKRITFSERNPRKDVFREADLRIRQRMSADSELSYGDAMKQVFAADEDLHRAYLGSVPPRQFNNRQE